MFQPEVKYEFVRRYCPPSKGWLVFVDIDPSEEGRTGGERKTSESRARLLQMQSDSTRVRMELLALGVTLGGGRAKWFWQNALPPIAGDRDIVAFHPASKLSLIVEVEGVSSAQPEQKLYKAIGQIVVAASTCVIDGWDQSLVLVVHGTAMANHLKRAAALQKLGVSALNLTTDQASDRWIFGGPPMPADIFGGKPINATHER